MRISFWALGLGLLLFFCARMTHGTFRFTSLPREQARQQLYQYGMLSEGFRRGHLYLAVEPSPEILALKNPFYPWNRKPLTYVWDASLYHGKYYLYFSPLPALLYHLPASYLLGYYPDQGFELLFFVAFATLFLFLTLRELHGDNRSLRTAHWVTALLMCGLANGAMPTLDNATWYTLATGCGSFWSSLFLYCLARMQKRGATPLIAAIAGLAVGLAFWSRPNLGVLFLLPAYFGYSVLRKRFTLTPKAALLFLIPWGLGLGAVGTYNYQRFGSPFDYGYTYQLGVKDLRAYPFPHTLSDIWVTHRTVWPLLLATVPEWHGAGWGKLKPRPIPARPMPPEGNYLCADATVGLFLFFPAAFLLFLLFPAVRRPELSARWTVQWAGLLAGLAFVQFFFFAHFGFVTARYHVDVMPLLLIAVLTMWFEWIAVLGEKSRRNLNAVAGGLCVVSLAVCALL